MTATVSSPVRWARAGALAFVAVTAGVAGHTTADGLLPGQATLAGLLLAAAVGCAALLGRPASRRRVVGLLVAGQAGVHAVLTATAGHVGDPVVAPTGAAPGPPVTASLPQAAVVADDSGRRVGSLQDQYAALAPDALGDPSTGPAGSAAAPGDALGQLAGHLVGHLLDQAPMAVAHLVAAVVVGLWLASGERAFATLLALARTVLSVPAVTAVVAQAAPRVRRTDRRDPRPPAPVQVLAPVVVRRGPPALLAG